MIYIFAIIVLLVFIILAMVCMLVCKKEIKDKIKKKLKKVLKSMIWNNSIISYKIAHFTTTLAAGDQIMLYMKGSEYQTPIEVIISFSMISCMVIFVIFLIFYLNKNYKVLPDKFDRIGNLYPNISFLRDKPIIYRFPLFMLHRILYVLYAKCLYWHITFGIQLLIMTTLFYTVYLFKY